MKQDKKLLNTIKRRCIRLDEMYSKDFKHQLSTGLIVEDAIYLYCFCIKYRTRIGRLKKQVQQLNKKVKELENGNNTNKSIIG